MEKKAVSWLDFLFDSTGERLAKHIGDPHAGTTTTITKFAVHHKLIILIIDVGLVKLENVLFFFFCQSLRRLNSLSSFLNARELQQTM